MDTGIRSERVDSLFVEAATLSRYLDVEIALARTQAALGLIPERAAEAIATFATVENIERERYRRSFATQQVGVAAGHVRTQVGGMLEAMVQDHERAQGHGRWSGRSFPIRPLTDSPPSNGYPKS